MKILLPEHAENPDQRRLLFYEADVGRKLAHPNVIKILIVNRDPNLPYFIMEFFPSGSLRTKMQLEADRLHQAEHREDLQTGGDRPGVHECQRLDSSRRKPANILVNGLGEVRIIDFAIAYRPPTGLARYFGRKQKVAGHPQLHVARADTRACSRQCAPMSTALAPLATRS